MVIQSSYRWDPGVFVGCHRYVVVVGGHNQLINYVRSLYTFGSSRLHAVCDWLGRLAMVVAAMADEGRVAAVAARGTVTLWSAHVGTVKHFRGNVLTAGEWVKQDPASRRLRCQSLGIAAVAVSRRCHEPPPVYEAAWAVRQQHRLAGVRHVRRSQDYIVCMHH